jgi:hypothetical protein
MMQTKKPWFLQSPWHTVTPAAEGSVGCDQSEEETLGMWRALLISLAVGFLGVWSPLGVLISRWVR